MGRSTARKRMVLTMAVNPLVTEPTAKPTAPSTLERWFPIAVWLPKYKWGSFTSLDLIAAVSVAALLIPESIGYASVAGVPAQIGLYCAPLALVGYASSVGRACWCMRGPVRWRRFRPASWGGCMRTA